MTQTIPTNMLSDWLSTDQEDAIAVHSTNIYRFLRFLEEGSIPRYEDNKCGVNGLYIDPLKCGFKGTDFEKGQINKSKKIVSNKELWSKAIACMSHLYETLPHDVVGEIESPSSAILLGLNLLERIFDDNAGMIYWFNDPRDHIRYSQALELCKQHGITEQELLKRIEESKRFKGLQLFFGDKLYKRTIIDSPDCKGDELVVINSENITLDDISSVKPLGEIEKRVMDRVISTGKTDLRYIQEALQ